MTAGRLRAELFDADEDVEWQVHANCLGCDPELFFADKFGHITVAHAKRVCAACPVRQDCLEYAVRHHERFGVWGGTTFTERRHLWVGKEPAA